MIALMIAATSLTAQAHTLDKAEYFDSAKTTVQAQIHNVLHSYYALKDALASDNAKGASNAATQFVAALTSVDAGKMSAQQRDLFTPLAENLRGDAEQILSSSNIDQIREHFASLSDNMLTLVTSFKANSGEVVYSDYCPMQKATWLSNQQPIKNPYLGRAMSTCGSIKQTIK